MIAIPRPWRRPSPKAALTVLFVVFGIAWGGFLGARHLAAVGSALDQVENLSLDWRYSLVGPRVPPPGVVIAAIDEDTIRQAGSFPLPRHVLAKIVSGLARYNPQVICVDVLLLDPGTPDTDRELADALHATRSVIGAVALFDPDDANGQEPARPGGDDFIPAPARILWPQDIFRQATRSGLSNVSTDRSGVPRYVPMLFASGGMIVPSFALASAAAALNTDPVLGKDVVKLRARSVALDLGYHLPLRFYGPSGSFRDFGAWRAINGELEPDDVRGQVVVVGATAFGTGDRFATPFDRVTPGVEIFATAISNLLAGDGLIRDSLTRGIDAAIAVALPVAAVLLLALRPLWLAIALTTSAFVAWVVALVVAFTQGYWLSFAVPAAAAVPVAVTYGVGRLWVEQRAVERFASETEVLRRFQAPGLLALLTKDPALLAKPVRQQAAILFVDLSGFTGLTESLGPAWTRDLLVELHERIERAATDHHGFVVSYMGDGAMILFGLPAPQPGDAACALAAVERLHRDLSAWLGNLPPVALGKLLPRVGGHFGPVILSRLGAADHQHIAATGDTVNVASRLLEVSKQHNAPIAVSEDLYRAAALPGTAAEHGLGEAVEIDIRGRTHPVSVRLGGLDAGRA
jgi:adenylate cyclase